MANSNKIIAQIIHDTGKIIKGLKIGHPGAVIYAHRKNIKILNKIWPAVILANKRIAKLKIRDIYDTYSININNGVIVTGTPPGKNKTKSSICDLNKPTILVPIKVPNDQ